MNAESYAVNAAWEFRGLRWGLRMPARLLKQAIEAWRADAPNLADWAEANLQDGFTVFNFPPAQLRLRVADSSRINPETIMPAYYKTEGLRAVAAAYQGRPVLSAQQVEDVVVYLSTLR